MNKSERTEILLANAIDLLINQGYDYDELQQELGLTDEERKVYLEDTFGEE